MNKKDLQVQIAASSEELLKISRAVTDIQNMCFEKEDLMFIKLQCKFQLKRLDDLEEKLRSAGEALCREEAGESLQISLNLLQQNLMLIGQNKQLLKMIYDPDHK